MRISIFTLFLVFTTLQFLNAQTKLTGVVVSEDSKEPIQGVVISAPVGEPVTSRQNGTFEMTFAVNLSSVELSFAIEDYLTIRTFELDQDQINNLGEILLNYIPNIAGDFIPTVVLDVDDDEIGRDENISGILTASRDVFSSTAAFVFGPARFRIRGFDSENNLAFIAVMEQFLARHLHGRQQVEIPDVLADIIDRVTVDPGDLE